MECDGLLRDEIAAAKNHKNLLFGLKNFQSPDEYKDAA
jgi:hypothetical protein